MTLELWQCQLSEEGCLGEAPSLSEGGHQNDCGPRLPIWLPPNWQEADKEVLKLEKIEQVVVSRPGALFYNEDDYLEAFPNGIDYHRREGHYEGHLLGEEGFYVPQKRAPKSQMQFHPASGARVNCG